MVGAITASLVSALLLTGGISTALLPPVGCAIRDNCLTSGCSANAAEEAQRRLVAANGTSPNSTDGENLSDLPQ